MFRHPCRALEVSMIPLAVLLIAVGANEQKPLWYETERVLDLTGDGIPDTLRARAFGSIADSLVIEFTIMSLGHEAYRDQWGSGAFFVDLDTVPAGGMQAASNPDGVRRAMHQLLSSSAVGRLPDWQDMLANTELVFIYSVHRQYRVTIAWSQVAERFLVIDS